jgi:ectoine hydroxylase-related dioxygenase (phytanoyl-CoA dioxygenase family)
MPLALLNMKPWRLSVAGSLISKIFTLSTNRFFSENGYMYCASLLDSQELAKLRNIYDQFVNGSIEVGNARSDLSGLTDADAKKEKITQIMRPSYFYKPLASFPIYQKALHLVQSLLGEDMAFDFDMLIDKAPHTHTPTPWHQDEAYWIDMEDKRAATCWIALDDVFKENGCMWFVPGSHRLEIRKHIQTGQKGALQCEANEEEAIAIPLTAGDGTFHDGRTIHYSRGNDTPSRRRALILNFRPAAMIAFERQHGFDHLGERAVRSKKADN